MGVELEVRADLNLLMRLNYFNVSWEFNQDRLSQSVTPSEIIQISAFHVIRFDCEEFTIQITKIPFLINDVLYF
jgi:hypothetical protein